MIGDTGQPRVNVGTADRVSNLIRIGDVEFRQVIRLDDMPFGGTSRCQIRTEHTATAENHYHLTTHPGASNRKECHCRADVCGTRRDRDSRRLPKPRSR